VNCRPRHSTECQDHALGPLNHVSRFCGPGTTKPDSPEIVIMNERTQETDKLTSLTFSSRSRSVAPMGKLPAHWKPRGFRHAEPNQSNRDIASRSTNHPSGMIFFTNIFSYLCRRGAEGCDTWRQRPNRSTFQKGGPACQGHRMSGSRRTTNTSRLVPNIFKYISVIER
jgi:hypothetical protein